MATEDRPAVSYIVAEVRERDLADPTADLVALRQALHRACEELGLDAADVPVPFNRQTSYTGTPNPWEALRTLFWSVFPPSLQKGPRATPAPPGRAREAMMTMVSMMGLYEDLDWLRDHGALAGIAELVRERKRQVGKGLTVAYDRKHHAGGTLVRQVARTAGDCLREVTETSEGPEYVEDMMRRAGSLAAAEIDRVLAEFMPEAGHAGS